MKRTTKIIGTLSLAIAMTSAVTPIYALEGQEPLAIESPEVYENKVISATDSWQEKINYIKYEGVIKDIKPQEGYISVSLTDGENDEVIAVFSISDDTMVVDQSSRDNIKNSELKVGQNISGYYSKDTIMIMIYPPRISPELVIVEDEERKETVMHSNFNEELLSADNTLKLMNLDETVITNQFGEEREEEDLYNQDLVVFYSISTKSLPAHTSPSKIIVLEKQLDKDVVTADGPEVITDIDENAEIIELDEDNFSDEIIKMIEADNYVKEEVTMVPLRTIAEHLGYKVEWNNKERSALITKDNVSFTLSIGKEEYGYNEELRAFERAPEINTGKTYVPQTFVDILR